LFSLVWTMALLGALFSLGKRVKRPLLSTGLYVAMGWMVLRSALPWISQVSATGVTLLLAGGAAYTVGAAMFLLSSRLPLAHLVWRLFVMAGRGCISLQHCRKSDRRKSGCAWPSHPHPWCAA